jgi:hypothetical protein
MSDEEKLIRFSTMISRLNNTKAGRVKVKPKETVVKKAKKCGTRRTAKRFESMLLKVTLTMS